MLKRLVPFVIFPLMISGCIRFPSAKEAGLKFSTEKSKLPPAINWRKPPAVAKEIINPFKKIVLVGAGINSIPDEKWRAFEPSFPWKKNIDRHLLFNASFFYRSPGTKTNCNADECIIKQDYKGYNWVQLAKPVAVDFIPAGEKTDLLKPANGHLVVKTIEKCQALLFTDSIYQLTDSKGNYYVMHACEKASPDTTVALPQGWTLRKVMLKDSLIVSPFGGGDDCYFNIVGDALGQGYHQYIFAGKFYPGE